MFKCRSCQGTEFRLLLQPDFKGSVEVDQNAHGDVLIRVNGTEFVADLMFMNQFAVCAGCDTIGAWLYYYPQSDSTTE